MYKSIIRKPAVFGIFILITSIFAACNDPASLFKSDLGPKVSIEPPSITVDYPTPNSFLTGIETFTGTAKAYIRVVDVQIKIFEDTANGQREIPWTTEGIKLEGGVKSKTWEFEFDTSLYNSGNDGLIRIQFLVRDPKALNDPKEAVKTPELVYVIKNKPSDIKMTTPDNTVIEDPMAIPKVSYGGEIQGQVIDRKGLMPGFPQIKLWPEADFPDEPDDEDPHWGWVTLFLPGIDSLQKEGADAIEFPAGPGRYEDRRDMAVVRASNFSYLLAENDGIEIDPDNPELRKIRYKVDTDKGKHIPFPSGTIYKFRIRTRDTNSDPRNGFRPIPDSVYLEGFFPPLDFGKPTEDRFQPREEGPVRFIIFSADSRPIIEINNDDIKDDVNLGQKALDSKPNIWITEPTSKKIALGKTGKEDFRLRLFIHHPMGIKNVVLSYLHESTTVRSGELSWDVGKDGVYYEKGDLKGALYTFTAFGERNIFTSSSDPYILIVTVEALDGSPATESRFTVYMDGKNPDVSIRSIKGAAADPISAAVVNYNGLINASTYVVNGNIQVVVDRTDDSGIMAYRANADMGKTPPEANYPMVKWVLEKAEKTETEPKPSDSTLAKLRNFKDDPSANNLMFFNDIENSQSTIGASGWVMRPLKDADAKNDADKTNHFKINTLPFDGQYMWLYVIAQDQVQNLGWVAQKIYVDQNTDKPVLDIPILFERNGSDATYLPNDEDGNPVQGKPIQGPEDLDVAVAVSVSVTNPVRTGNVKKRNIIDKDSNIVVNIRDDDGVDLTDGGVTITLTVLDPLSDPGKKTVTFTSEQIVQDMLKSPIRNKRDISLLITQEIMAKALEVLDVDDEFTPHKPKESLNDGMYKLEITVKDDIKEKVEITPYVNDGDQPKVATAGPLVYHFAVFNQSPKVTVIRPDDNAWGSEEPIDINGTVRSRFQIQNAWIIFTPNVIADPPSNTSLPVNLPLTPAATNPDADGYYLYTWERPGVVFHPKKDTGDAYFDSDVRRFDVVAFDRLGNSGSVTRSVQIDATPPVTTLSEYNHGRPPELKVGDDGKPVLDKDGKPVSVTYLYGKVPFTVSATDENGLYEVDGKSGIKWWVVPVTDPADVYKGDPSWSTGYTEYTNTSMTPNKWTGGGNFNLNQSKGGRYTWVIDTRYLEDGKEYKLCLIALDKAGNQSRIVLERDPATQNPKKTTNTYETFIVNQDKDYPTIDEISLDPLKDSVKPKGTAISGTVSDADLFNPANRDQYVQIRFPTGVVNGVPVWADDWIPVKIPETYSSLNGGIDPSGAIAFKFKPEDYKTTYPAALTYLSTDGIKYYQIRVSDEPVGPTLTTEKFYGKNPDYFMVDVPDKDNDNGNYPNYPYVFHDKVSKIFPSETGSYTFIVDDTYPEIFFTTFDPTKTSGNPPEDHPGYSEARPTFSNVQLLLEALNGYVKEYKLSDLSMSYSGKVNGNDEIFRKIILNSPKDPATSGKYDWNLKDGTAEFELIDKFDLTPGTGKDLLFKQIFDDPEQQGMQIIVFEATDMVPLTRRVSYIFWKDTQGPEINFNITRAIQRDPIPAYPGSGAGAWPSDWPSDWRYSGTAWQTGWNATWRTFITSWPSEYAFVSGANIAEKAKKIQEALEADYSRQPSTVIGDPEEKSGSPETYNEPVITGSFSDDLSAMRIPATAINPDPKTNFYYRFKDKKRNMLAIPDGIPTATFADCSWPDAKWIEKSIEVQLGADGKPIIQNERRADWKIVLNRANGFTGADGENLVDIRVADSAGNISDIYNVRFLVDRTAPVLGKHPNPPDMPTDADEFLIHSVAKYNGTWTQEVLDIALPEMQRVFSADGTTNSPPADGAAFILQGTVSDANFSGMVLTIGQEGPGSTYTVTSTLSEDPANPGKWKSVDSDGAATSRLKLDPDNTSPDNTLGFEGAPEWTWTLEVRNKDVAQLRAAAGTAAADSTRRFVRVTASDKANKRVGPVDWFFYLDTKKPELEYTNLEKGTGLKASSFENAGLSLSGLVSDDTRIKDVRYMIGRWDYAGGGGWTWSVNGTDTWTSNIPSNPASWPSVFESETSPGRQSTMNWVINKETIGRAAGIIPANLFDQEGYYRLDLYVTDFSLGSGNPHYTYNVNEPNLVPPFEDANYNATGTRSGRVFYIDKDDPILKWGWFLPNGDPDPEDIYNTTNKTYFKNVDGQANFSFTVGDGNTIQYWKAEITEVQSGTTVILQSNGIKWVSEVTGGTSPVTSISQAIPDPPISLVRIDEQKLVIRPFMTVDATSGGQALDVAAGTLPTYTITITVKDGAGRSNSIKKQFTLDNTPPRFLQDKFNPLSYERGTDSTPAVPEDVSKDGYDPKITTRTYSYDAVTGRMNIRGNTEDNSNQIANVSYYVVNSVDSPGFNTFPNAKEVTDKKWWRSAVDKNSGIPDDNSPYIQIDEGTFAWKIMVPQTSLFFSDTDAQKYAQIKKTGGIPIAGPSSPSVQADTYRDITGISETAVTMATPDPSVPHLTFQDLNNKDYPDNPKRIYGGEDVVLITVYVRAEDAAGNVAYDIVKYWIWPEGDRPIITKINNPDGDKIEAERLLNGTIRLSGMAKDNERVRYVWFRVFPSKDGVITGAPYTLSIPEWDEKTWEEASPKADQKPVDAAPNGTSSFIGAIRSTDSFGTYTGGWYKANGGGSRDVSWWAYINTKGELDPPANESKKEFTVEVRAQDQTFDEKADQWKEYTTTYRGLASTMSSASKVTAWVVAGAPIFENQRVATVASNAVTDWDEKETGNTSNDPYVYSLDKLNIKDRSSYRVIVKHNSGLSSIRWSPTQWTVNTANPNGIFQANTTADTYNLLDLLSIGVYNKNNPYYVYWDGSKYVTDTQTNVFTAMEYPKDTATTPQMAVTVKPSGMYTASVSGLSTSKNYLILKWDEALETNGFFAHDSASHMEAGPTPGPLVHKDMKNTIFKPLKTSGNIGDAIIIEAVTENVPGSANTVDYFKWEVIVDVRADLLLRKMTTDDPNYGKNDPDHPTYDPTATARAGQYIGSVRYPVYLSATEVSKANPLTQRGDALLPIDTKKPYGQYTLNRKPAGSAATIGGEAGDAGPVSGIARVVLWFSRKGTGNTLGDFVSWHENITPNNTFVVDPASASTPVWWKDVSLPDGVKKPAIGPENSATGGDSAIVIDRNSPSVGVARWGHRLPMGFADGGIGKYWYVEINSLGLKSGPVDLHFVVMDKAGNYKYYRERLIIMNGVAVIDRVKLGTDIRYNTSLYPANSANGKITSWPAANTNTAAVWPLLNTIRTAVPLGGDSADLKNDVRKGISDWVPSSALGAHNIVDFNVRNNLFALRVETTNQPSDGKDRNFRLEYVSSATLLRNTSTITADNNLAKGIKAGRVYIINEPGDGNTAVKWGAVGAEGDSWKTGDVFIAAIDGQMPDENDKLVDKISGIGSVWELNSNYPATGERTGISATNLQLGDVKYATTEAANAKGAEFVYGNSAFGTTAGTSIVDYTNIDDEWPPAVNINPVTGAPVSGAASGKRNALFILRVFDGPEDDMFGAFTILRVRVNNDDQTEPFAQLYDINPKTEGQERQNIAKVGDNTANELTRSISPMFVGEGTGSNRTKGGLWNNDLKTVTAVEKPGHIEPMVRTGTDYNTAPYTNQITVSTNPIVQVQQQHSLSSAQMGGVATPAEATIQKPWADPRGFFTSRDTVSGKVVLRGYAEDDQRVHQVVLTIGTTTVTILDYDTGAGNPGNNDSNSANYSPPLTGLLKTNSPNNVYFTDSIDAYRHRVEWAYIWDTETVGGTVAGNNVNVSVTSYNRSGLTAARKTASDTITSPGKPHDNKSTLTKPNTSPFNKEFPVGLNKYNSIGFNVRPYITGFLRNKTQFSHDTRSRQGRYMFYRGEQAVVTGFNLGSGSITIPGMSSFTTTAVTNPGDFGIQTSTTILPEATRNMRYRQFTVNATSATTGDGVVTYSYNSQDAVNTGNGKATSTERKITAAPIRPSYIQPWNIEYSPGIDGSQLWDDFTQVHIWQSNDTTSNDGGRFPKGVVGVNVFDPSMSIDPATGTLWSAHNEGGGGGFNTGSTKVGNNNGEGSQTVITFCDPIINSDIFISTRPSGQSNNRSYSVWTTYSMIGRSGDTKSWTDYGGVYITGPQGGWPNLRDSIAGTSGGSNGFKTDSISALSQYLVESTGFNAGTNTNNNVNFPPGDFSDPPSRNQFKNPHIITDYRSSEEHIHVSYYDSKDGSIKYHYNRRNNAGNMPGGTDLNSNPSQGVTTNAVPYAWTNLDGGFDLDDQNAFNASGNTNWASGTGGGNYVSPWTSFTTGIAQNGRIVNYSTRSALSAANRIDAGEYNSIALTSQGYPVIAYYDKTNQKLKMAISNDVVPIAASHWTIIDNVITLDPKVSSATAAIAYGTGEYVSMKIDTRNNANIVHIAAMNSSTGNLVYVKGTIGTSSLTGVTAQVVDSVGSVGFWCSLSLDDQGNPWISYQDKGYQSSRDGVKLAHYIAASYYKGSNTYRSGEDVDLYGNNITGWETMHVPTAYRVENARLGMECYPARNYTGTPASKNWSGAVGYLSNDYFRVAYYWK